MRISSLSAKVSHPLLIFSPNYFKVYLLDAKKWLLMVTCSLQHMHLDSVSLSIGRFTRVVAGVTRNSSANIL